MQKVMFIHGAFGDGKENWFPWLKKKLEEMNCEVIVPVFPTPENQTLGNWMKVFDAYKEHLDEDLIVVAHSLGSAFVMKILEEYGKKIKAAFFISGFTGLLDNPTFDRINRTFVDKKFDWEKIRKNCGKFYLFHSDNDPYVPLEKGQDLAENLKTNLIIVPKAGHFNKESGYIKFYLLLEKIKESTDQKLEIKVEKGAIEKIKNEFVSAVKGEDSGP